MIGLVLARVDYFVAMSRIPIVGPYQIRDSALKMLAACPSSSDTIELNYSPSSLAELLVLAVDAYL
jgi:hypothetical protein